MKIYQRRYYGMTVGNIQFNFIKPPTKVDIRKAFETWMGGESETPGTKEALKDLLVNKNFVTEVIEN